jgi:threonine dehydrogenase-like Zn-dependent dehydrogenase
MNGQIADAVIEALTVLKDTLRPGERVVVEVSELCGECREGMGDLDGGPCAVCGGKAWIERQVTLRA